MATPTWQHRAPLLVAIGLILAACGADVSTSSSSPPPASETAASPSAAASPSSASPGQLPLGGPIALSPGNYSLADFPARISFDIPAAEAPAGWFGCSPSSVEQAVCYTTDADSDRYAALTFQIVDNVRTPPCSDQDNAELLDPPVGPSVDDLVAAISNLEGYEATPAEDISMSGFSGKEFTLTAEQHGCGATWSTTDRVTGMGADEINRLRVLDVNGERVLIASAYGSDTPQAEIAAVEQVLDSVQIEP